MDCRRCKTELVRDEKRKCLYCPVCHPPQTEQEKIEEKKRVYIDLKPTEKRVAEMVRDIIETVVPDMIRDEMEKLYIPKPAMIEELKVSMAKELKPADWRQEAKALGITLYQRTKKDVLKEIEERKNTRTSGTSCPEKDEKS